LVTVLRDSSEKSSVGICRNGMFGIECLSSWPSQLDDTLNILEEGSLPEGVLAKIEALWEVVKDEAPVDCIAK
jgi:hypothetical protein